MVDSLYADAVDTNGLTLIPPTLKEFAHTFVENLYDTTGLDLPITTGNLAGNNTIFITIAANSTNATFLDAAGRWTSEGYTLDVTESGITIIGASPLGAWWGTVTVLQQAVLNNGSISIGSGTDAPGWGERGMMLDVGRHYYPPEFLVEMCAYFSFFKQNIFHLHLSDNLYNNAAIYSYERSMDLYAAFRPWSEDPAVAGLNKRQNESYTRAEFDWIQTECASRGVTIIPEIEAPGHALVITQWKPELGRTDDYSLLNISVPETTPTMEAIWDTFLPWFHSKVLHIGADEYTGPEADYITFVNDLNDYITSTSTRGQSIRNWGTFVPYTNGSENVNTSVSVQHWEFFEDNPYFNFIKNGYHVLNSDDGFYAVSKWSGSYPPVLNLTRVFYGNPENHGPYAPNIFDTNNATNNPPRDNPYVLGQTACLWNDYGPNATVYSEAFYSIRDALPALGDKQWGGSLTLEQYHQIFDTLQAAAPGQNLDRRIPSISDTIFFYDFSAGVISANSSSIMIPDDSGNDYDAVFHGPSSALSKTNGSTALHFTSESTYLKTPLSSKGRNYTLSFSINIDKAVPGAPILTGSDSSLITGYSTTETPNNNTLVTLLPSSGTPFSLNYSLPVGEWIDLELIGRGNATYLKAGGEEMEFITVLGINGDAFEWMNVGVEAPLSVVGGGAFKGWISGLKLTGSA